MKVRRQRIDNGNLRGTTRALRGPHHSSLACRRGRCCGWRYHQSYRSTVLPTGVRSLGGYLELLEEALSRTTGEGLVRVVRRRGAGTSCHPVVRLQYEGPCHVISYGSAVTKGWSRPSCREACLLTSRRCHVHGRERTSRSSRPSQPFVPLGSGGRVTGGTCSPRRCTRSRLRGWPFTVLVSEPGGHLLHRRVATSVGLVFMERGCWPALPGSSHSLVMRKPYLGALTGHRKPSPTVTVLSDHPIRGSCRTVTCTPFVPIRVMSRHLVSPPPRPRHLTRGPSSVKRRDCTNQPDSYLEACYREAILSLFQASLHGNCPRIAYLAPGLREIDLVRLCNRDYAHKGS